MKAVCLFICVLVTLGIATGLGSEEPTGDYLTGYVQGVLEGKFGIQKASVRADGNAIIIRLPQRSESLQKRIRTSLSSLPDGVQVRFESGFDRAESEQKSLKVQLDRHEFLPDKPLFEPLMADPRWPHFSASYQSYLNRNDFENVGHTSFGESFVFYRMNSDVRWEVGLQAGVFAIFDLDAESFDLINADYRVSLPVFLRWHPVSGMVRILHQSSHLGDEFILRGRADERENLSYEKLDSLISLDLPFGSRLYGGGGVLVNKNPSDLDPWSVQGGLEWVCPHGFGDGLLHPVASVDLQSEEENDWDLDVSAKAGLQLGTEKGASANRLQLTLEYYQGHSPNGQFYDELIEYVGFGLHYYR
ncbi:MAG: DUF1207 domain-containing protein [Desulfovermiculus sp.]